MIRRLLRALACKTHNHDYYLWMSEFTPGSELATRVVCRHCGDCVYQSSAKLPPVATDKGDW